MKTFPSTGSKLSGDWGLGFFEQSKIVSQCNGPRGAGPLVPTDIANLKKCSLRFFGPNYAEEVM